MKDVNNEKYKDYVKYSRAGDTFHYRWTARRCLKMINPNSGINSIFIEASKGPKISGECVIDVSEYTQSSKINCEDITFFQLKHSTKQLDKHFNLSDFKHTIEQFSKRFLEEKETNNIDRIKFRIITNRPINATLKQDILLISKGANASKRNKKTLQKYTALNDVCLKQFCDALDLFDSEGDYEQQKYTLNKELSNYMIFESNSDYVELLIAFIQQRALPNSDGKITREDVLNRLGVTSEQDLFPAPFQLEKIENPIKRSQHDELLEQIFISKDPIIIHASGGVGKSIVAQQLADSLSNGSIGIVYDCFAGGQYRNRSKSRHLHEIFVLQIINELASQSLCEVLLPAHHVKEHMIFTRFLDKLQEASYNLRRKHPDAIIAIFVDAADNAEMIAKDLNENCFAHELLRENLPEGCKLVVLCRTERRNLLTPSSSVKQIELLPFTETETTHHVMRYFSELSYHDIQEFHRLTNKNPRVQANYLTDDTLETISDILLSLGPDGSTVEELIENRLDSAINKIADIFGHSYETNIERICTGLATLPPSIPLEVLAKMVNVDISTIQSFVSDLGRGLLVSDNYVRIQDEPTEKWFRDKYHSSRKNLDSYIEILKPLAQESTYVAEVIPSLLLQAGQSDELITLAFSEDCLPTNAVKKRNVRIYRLQFAFKAACKAKKYSDTIKLALKTGEVTASKIRQRELLRDNIDLFVRFSREQVQPLAYKKDLKGLWSGSEYLYSAALLSSINDFKGEARSYLKSARNYLRLYSEERDKVEDNGFNQEIDAIENELPKQILEFAFIFYNLDGPEKLVNYFNTWSPKDLVFFVARNFIRRLIDDKKFNEIDRLAEIGFENQYLMLAIADELISVGYFPPVETIRKCLALLLDENNRIPIPDYRSYDPSSKESLIGKAIVSFAEIVCSLGLPKDEIKKLLDYYIPHKASYAVKERSAHSPFQQLFLRCVALRAVLADDLCLEMESLLPEELLKEKNSSDNKKRRDTTKEIDEYKNTIERLLPWYIVRTRILAHHKISISEIIDAAIKNAHSAFGLKYNYDPTPFKQAAIYFDVLMLYKNTCDDEIKKFKDRYLNEEVKIWLPDAISALRAACRQDHLLILRNPLESYCRNIIENAIDDTPEQQAESYISLSRAILVKDQNDAEEYFNEAIKVVSRYGDELRSRWLAVMAIAKRTLIENPLPPKLVYRFMRCAELIAHDDKHERSIDLDQVMTVCSKMHSTSALAILSRWRDRDIGWFPPLINALATEMVCSKIISPSAGWSLSAFFRGFDLAEFAVLCILKENNPKVRQYILDSAVRDIALNIPTERSEHHTYMKGLIEIYNISQEISLYNAELEKLVDFYKNQSNSNLNDTISDISSNAYKKETTDFEFIFNGLNLANGNGLNMAIKRFKETERYQIISTRFWKEVFKRISEENVLNFLRSFPEIVHLDIYDVTDFFKSFPKEWKQKPSVKKSWISVIESTVRRYAPSILLYGKLEHFSQSIPELGSQIDSIKHSIIDGLSKYNADSLDSEVFFAFVENISSLLSHDEALNLLDYALNRFEIHMEDDIADGLWRESLLPPENITDSFTGLVWSALGAPHSKVRWQAAHCIRRLAKMGCQNEINSLIEWMEEDSIKAFGDQKFPFYYYHAKQYLLISLARIALDNASILKAHSEFFMKLALYDSSHILIQKYSSDIAILIEKEYSGTYDDKIVHQLHNVCVSQLPNSDLRPYRDYTDTPWQIKMVR